MSLTLDIRYPKNAVVADVSANVEAALKKEDMGVLRCIITPILYISKETPLIKKLCKVYAEETGEYLEPLAIGGGTYAKAIPNIVAFGPIFPGDEVREHKPDEFIEVEKLMKNAQIIAEAMYRLAK